MENFLEIKTTNRRGDEIALTLDNSTEFKDLRLQRSNSSLSVKDEVSFNLDTTNGEVEINGILLTETVKQMLNQFLNQ